MAVSLCKCCEGKCCFIVMVLEESKTEKSKILTNFNYLSRAATSPVGEFTVSSLVTLSSCLAWISFLKTLAVLFN